LGDLILGAKNEVNANLYVSGSTNLGASSSDTHQLTGSLYVKGQAQTKGFVSANGFGNSQVILTPTIIPAEYNCLLYGPVTLRDEGTLQIGTDSVVIVRSFLDFTGSLG